VFPSATDVGNGLPPFPAERFSTVDLEPNRFAIPWAPLDAESVGDGANNLQTSPMRA
jgi:hypothetical protein